MRQVLFLIILFFFFTIKVKAQFFTNGEDPGSVCWKQINTPNFQIIFPKEYKTKALQLSYVLEKVYDYGYRTLDHKPKKISVLLHTRTSISNGNVGWAPRRMEFFMTPDPSGYSQKWMDQLAIHEFRHTVQIGKIQSELPKILPALFGEQITAAIVGVYLPFWFLEGDAVSTETALSKAGRGREPSFLMEMKAQIVENGLYSYDKAVLGSYRDHVPDRYHFGYCMVAGLRSKYGTGIWKSVIDSVARHPFSLNPMNSSLNKTTGMKKEQLYEKLFLENKAKWEIQIDAVSHTTGYIFAVSKDSYTDYRVISVLSDTSVIALKDSRSDIDRIVKISPYHEEVLFTPGVLYEETISASGNLLLWVEQHNDIRWTLAHKTVVVLYDVRTKKKKEFYFKSIVASPVISPDHNVFAAVETEKTGQFSLSVFSLKTGKRISRIHTDDNIYFFTPAWNASSDKLFFIGINQKGKFLASVNSDGTSITKLTEPTFDDLKNLRCFNGKLYYISSATGIDNVFCYDLTNHNNYQITSVRYGANFPSVSGNSLFFSSYTANGYTIEKMNLSYAVNRDLNNISPARYELAEKLASQEDTVFTFSDTVKAYYPIKNYHKAAHLFNFHSWGVPYIDAFDYGIKPGVTLSSQNVLGTALTQLGYTYDPDNKTGEYTAEFKYTGLYPVINTKLSYGKEKAVYSYIFKSVNQLGEILETDTLSKEYSWNDLECELNLNLPLHFSHGKYSQLLQPAVKYDYNKITHDNITPSNFFEGYYHSLSGYLYFQNIIKQSELDIVPDWGQIVNMVYRHDLGGELEIGTLASIETYLYFPGIMRNQGIRLYNGYQTKEENSSLSFSDKVRFPRGISNYQNKNLYTFGIDYITPLCYPDKSFGKLFYLKRIRANIFYDLSHIQSAIYNKNQSVGTYTRNLSSTGIQVIADGNIFRLLPMPLSIGFRTIYLPETSSFRVDGLMSVNFGF